MIAASVHQLRELLDRVRNGGLLLGLLFVLVLWSVTLSAASGDFLGVLVGLVVFVVAGRRIEKGRG